MSDAPLELRQQAENLLKAINEGTGSARALIVTLLVLAVYIFIVVAGTNDEQLLRNSSVAVPTLSNAVVPANAFYAVMPWAFVFLHLDLLIHLGLMSDKLYRFNEAVEAIPDPLEARDLRLRLAGFPFANWLGSDPRQAWVLYLLQGLTVWLSLAVIPLLLLTYLQLGFLAYHSEAITWGQRLALIFDVALLLYFWPRLVKGRYRLPQPERPVLRFSIRQRLVWRRWLWRQRQRLADGVRRIDATLPDPFKERAFRFARRLEAVLRLPRAWLVLLWGLFGLALWIILRRLWVVAITPLAAPLLFLSLLVATIPQEAMDIVARQWLGEVNAGDMKNALAAIADDKVRGEDVSARATNCAQWLTPLLSNPRGGVELPQALPASCWTLALFHLHGSPFHRTLRVQDRIIASGELRPDVVKKVRSTLNANKETTSPQPLREFKEAVFEVQGLDLTEHDLRFGNFRRSSFPRAIFDQARLDHADFQLADLRKVSLSGTKLHGADLSHANLRGANFRDADLSGADLGLAKLHGADLGGAKLWGADLRGPYLRGVNLSGANLWEADLSGAELRGVNLSGANLWKANLSGADLSDADLRGADLSGANLSGANLSEAQQAGVLMFEPVITGMLREEDIESALKVWDEEPSPDPYSRKHFENKLRRRLGQPTQGLDRSACIGVAPCPADAPCLQRHTKLRIEVLTQLVCPTEDQAAAKTAESVIRRLKKEADLDIKVPLPPPPWFSALAAAARQALSELASGPCRAELIKSIPKEYQPQTNTPVPASPPTPQPSSSQP